MRSKRIHCRVKNELHEFLKNYAHDHGMSIRAVIELLIQRLKDQSNSVKGAKPL